MTKPICVVEYESLTAGFGDSKLSSKQFELLKNFVLSNSESKDSPIDLMDVSVKKGKGEVITVRNYVGVVALSDGTQIEILPKIYGKNGRGEKDYEAAKDVLLDVLRTLVDAPSRSIQSSAVGTANLPLYETFVRMFLNEALSIFRRGFKRGYSAVDRNETFLKGKLVVSRHLRENFSHAERFFVEHDEFDENQAENRLLKSTLFVLEKKSRDSRNRRDIKFLLGELSDVDRSNDIEGDFKKVSVIERNNSYYRTALSWCKVFLRGESFTAFAGSEYAAAVLFPMDKLYERYVAKRLRQLLPREYRVRTQSEDYYLFDDSKFLLRPDIIVTHGDSSVILDTKWKVLDSSKSNCGISQGDMNQMYVYFKEYRARGEEVTSVCMLYPNTGLVSEEKKEKLRFENSADKGLVVKAKFIDLTSRFGFDEIVGEIKDELNMTEGIDQSRQASN